MIFEFLESSQSATFLGECEVSVILCIKVDENIIKITVCQSLSFFLLIGYDTDYKIRSQSNFNLHLWIIGL